jgi:hypothetical protein
MTTTTAAILSCEATTLAFGEGEPLACLYVVVDGHGDRRVADFLAAGHHGCERAELDWHPVRRPRSVLLGLELLHSCNDPDRAGQRLRLVFDPERDAKALRHLAATEALVVGTRAWGAFANAVAAYGVDGAAVRATLAAARAQLEGRAAAS